LPRAAASSRRASSTPEEQAEGESWLRAGGARSLFAHLIEQHGERHSALAQSSTITELRNGAGERDTDNRKLQSEAKESFGVQAILA
jgi:hypothetical protein